MNHGESVFVEDENGRWELPFDAPPPGHKVDLEAMGVKDRYEFSLLDHSLRRCLEKERYSSLSRGRTLPKDLIYREGDLSCVIRATIYS